MRRAKEILSNNELKQAICNRVIGISFRDIDKTMKAIIDERKPSKNEEEMLELLESHPEKLYPEIMFSSVKKNFRYGPPLTLWETMELFKAGETSIKQESTPLPPYYTTYSKEEVQQMMEEHLSRPVKEKK